MTDFTTFRQYIKESDEAGGAEAGTLEMHKISLRDAVKYAVAECEKYGRDLYEMIPNFDQNFKIAQDKFKRGSTVRKDMPVIATKNVKEFQRRLEQGYIDWNEPFHSDTDPRNPFPEGLSGKQAKEFLERGIHDGDSEDDKIKTFEFRMPAIKLFPIQQQVYFDKSIEKIARDSAEGCREFLEGRKLIASIDNYIIDGHHRLLTSLLIDPRGIMLQGIKIDIDINILKKLALAYGDAIGNKRNK